MQYIFSVSQIHFPGFIHTCSHCGVEKNSSTALRMHVHTYHRFNKISPGLSGAIQFIQSYNRQYYSRSLRNFIVHTHSWPYKGSTKLLQEFYTLRSHKYNPYLSQTRSLQVSSWLKISYSSIPTIGSKRSLQDSPEQYGS